MNNWATNLKIKFLRKLYRFVSAYSREKYKIITCWLFAYLIHFKGNCKGIELKTCLTITEHKSG